MSILKMKLIKPVNSRLPISFTGFTALSENLFLVMLVTSVSFKKREPTIAKLMSNVSFDVDVMNGLLAWKKDKGASAEEAAVRFLNTQKSTWSSWVSDGARKKLSAIIK